MGTDAIAVVEASMLKRDRGGFVPGDTVFVLSVGVRTVAHDDWTINGRGAETAGRGTETNARHIRIRNHLLR